MPEFLTESGPACPTCRSQKIFPHDDHSAVERILLRIVKIYPFRCRVCRESFYLFNPSKVDWARMACESRDVLHNAEGHE
jgi:hypothetical protein